MKPFHRRATIPTSVASSSSSINNDGVRGILRGGSTEIQLPEHDDDDGGEEYEYIEDGEGGDEYYYEDEDDENHIEAADCDEEEYEYHDDDEDDGIVEAEEEDDGYYYNDEYYDGGSDDEYIHLPDDDDSQWQQTKKRKLLPSLLYRRGTLSIVSLPTVIPNTISNLSQNCMNSLPNSLQELDPTGGSIIVLSIIALSILSLRSIIMIGSSSAKNDNVKRKGRKRNSIKHFFGNNNKSGESINEDETAKSYGDYSKGYPGDEDEEVDDDTLDLDDDETSNGGTNGSISNIGERKKRGYIRSVVSSSRNVVTSIPTSAGRMVHNSWIGICVLGRRYCPALPFRGMRKRTSVKGDGEYNDEGTGDDSSMMVESPSGEDDIIELENEKYLTLQQELDTVTQSKSALEQEYEASLRMLHEARLELRQLQSENERDNATSGSGEDNQKAQKEQMEIMVKKVEAKYKTQMKEQVERIRAQLEDTLRSEAESDLTEKITTELKVKLEKEQEELEEQLKLEMEERIAEVKRLTKEELNANFQRAVEEKSAAEVDRALDAAVQSAIGAEQAKSREEMLRVRQGIQKVLERERRLMREQVRNATGQVREWVVKQQQGQLLQQAAQLQEEAKNFGRGSQQQQQQQQRRGASPIRPQPGAAAGTRRPGNRGGQGGGRPPPSRRGRDGYD